MSGVRLCSTPTPFRVSEVTAEWAYRAHKFSGIHRAHRARSAVYALCAGPLISNWSIEFVTKCCLQVTDAGLEALIRGCPSLTKVVLTGTRVSMSSVSQMVDCAALQVCIQRHNTTPHHDLYIYTSCIQVVREAHILCACALEA